MAKRFTDTDKWKRPWFRKLPLKARMVWFFLLDNCDHAGVWHADFELLSFQVGFRVDPIEFEKWFFDKVDRFEGDRYQVPSFVEFQYGTLNPNNNTHRSVIQILDKLGAAQPLGCSSGGAQDKDKDKGSDKDKDKDKERLDYEALYRKYPRKLGKSEGLKKVAKEIQTVEVYDALSRAIDRFAEHHIEKQTEAQYLPHFSTFMTSWRDWLDPETGTASVAAAGIDWSKVDMS